MTTNGHHSHDPGFPALVEGVVEARNANGIRVGGDWHNVSKFKPVDLPDVGVRVRLGLDAKGFITTLELVKNMPYLDDAFGVERTPGYSGAAIADRDQRISRLAVLKAAASFGASRPECKSSDVLKIAASWLAWVEER